MGDDTADATCHSHREPESPVRSSSPTTTSAAAGPRRGPEPAPPPPNESTSPLDTAEVAQAVERLKTSKLYPGSPGYQAALGGLHDLQTSSDGATAAAPPALAQRSSGSAP